MGVLTLIWVFTFTSISLADPFAARLDCSRINVAFCCTSRLKDFCKEQCLHVQCGIDISHSMKSTDSTVRVIARDGDTGAMTKRLPSDWKPVKVNPSLSLTESSATNSLFPTLIPFVAETTSIPATPAVQPAILSQFQTPSPQTSIDQLGIPAEVSNTDGSDSPPPMPPLPDHIAMLGENQNVDITTDQMRVTKPPRIRTTPDPRIIRPPESLAFISDFDEDDSNVIEASLIVPQQPDFNHKFFQSFKSVSAPESSIPTKMEQQRNIEPEPGSEWKVSLLKTAGEPFPPQKPQSVKTPAVVVDGIAGFKSQVPDNRFDLGSSPDFSRFSQTFNGNPKTVTEPSPPGQIPPDVSSGQTSFNEIPDFRTAPSISGALENIIDRILPRTIGIFPSAASASINSTQPKYDSLKGMVGTLESVTSLPSRTTLTSVMSTAQTPKNEEIRKGFDLMRPTILIKPRKIYTPAQTEVDVNHQSCGVAPDFKPCVSAQTASAKLLQCCIEKNLPPGCQALCRYDISQAEVKAALDKGRCGIFHVAPFLQCASQEHDNTECCRSKGIYTKAGPQCEQFCNPGKGLTTLGIQHIVCGSMIGEMLYCHHSGIRE